MFILQFEENEKKRMKSEQLRQEQKHKKQWEELVFRNDSSLRELEQLQVCNLEFINNCHCRGTLKNNYLLVIL